jgi:penicillin-binding protein 2
MAGAVRIKDLQKELRMFLGRSMVAAVAIALLSLLLIGRLTLLQIIRYDYYLDLSQGNRARLEPIPANRGLILDRNGAVLAENQPSYQLELVREQVPDLEQTLQALGSLDLIPADEMDDVRRLIRSRRGFETVPVRLRLTEEQIARSAVHRHSFRAWTSGSPDASIRGALAVHALGYVGAISESDLRADRSRRLRQHDADQ